MAARELNWIGGEHRFDLRLGELRALQEACKAGPEEIFDRMRGGTWRLDDLVDTLRLGLIGAGTMEPAAAGVFVTELMARHPLTAFKIPAMAVLARAIFGEKDDPVGKPEGGEATPPAGGSSAGSTATVQ